MVVGVTSGFWIWSRKSVNSWRKFFNKICLTSNSPAARLPKTTSSSTRSSKLTPNSSVESSDDSDSSGCCCLALKDILCCGKRLGRKDSIVYFQAHDEIKPNLYDLPHNTVAFPQPYANCNGDNDDDNNDDDQFCPPVLMKTSTSLTDQQLYAAQNWMNLQVNSVGAGHYYQQQQQRLALASQGIIYEFPSSTSKPPASSATTTTSTNLTSSLTGSSLPSTISTIRR